MFCDSETALGVLEAEGTQPLAKVQTISNYFDSTYPILASLRFGILLQYAYSPSGRRAVRKYPAAETATVLDAVKETTRTRRSRSIFVIALDKTFKYFADGLRGHSEYYAGTISKVTGILIMNGDEANRITFFET